MSSARKTAIVTGASQGIGAGIVKAFVERGFNVVANSRNVTQSAEVVASNHVALVDGHIGELATAARIVETALSRFKSVDVLVNNASIFFTKPFTDYTAAAGERRQVRVRVSHESEGERLRFYGVREAVNQGPGPFDRSPAARGGWWPSEADL